MRQAKQATMIWIAILGGATCAAEDGNAGMAQLIAAYKTAPQGYPEGKDERGVPYARPDASVWYRWHFYHDEAIKRFEDAKMERVSACYADLEEIGGAEVEEGSPIRLGMAEEHVSAGLKALKVEIPASAENRTVTIHARQGAQLHPVTKENSTHAYFPNWRWLKFDAFNPSDRDVSIRVHKAPMLLKPGANVVAVKTTDIAGVKNHAFFPQLPISVPGQDEVVLFLDNVRVEQEVPSLIRQKGRLFEFTTSSGFQADLELMLWPGFVPVTVGSGRGKTLPSIDTGYTPELGYGFTELRKTRESSDESFRSQENAFLFACVEKWDSPFRVDLPNGRYGVLLRAGWMTLRAGRGASLGARREIAISLNGNKHIIQPAVTDAQMRARCLAGENWDYRPGYSLWESLVKPVFWPDNEIVYADVTDGKLMLEVSDKDLRVHALLIFPESDKDHALGEIGRLNYLLSESWDVSHQLLRMRVAHDGSLCLGWHEEMESPERIPEKLAQLKLTDEDFQRGFRVFQRDMMQPVYPDSVPSPAEASVKELECFASPGEFECMTFSLMPLAVRKGVRIEATDLAGPGNARIPAAYVDIRLSRYHQKAAARGHHNHCYSIQEGYLVKREKFDLYPGAAFRAYADVKVPADAVAGVYRGAIKISAEGVAEELPLVVDVLPIALQTPPVYFATEYFHPRLLDFGFNTFYGTYEDARVKGWKGYVTGGEGRPGSGPQQTLVAMAEEKDKWAPILKAGKEGKGPRGFFALALRGYGGGESNPTPNQRQLLERVAKDLPDADIPAVTMPWLAFDGGKAGDGRYWTHPRTEVKDNPALLEEAAKSGRDFGFFDCQRISREQAGRFTCGFWLWRSGASYRYLTNISANGGVSATNVGEVPYYLLIAIERNNICTPWLGSLRPGEANVTRDTVLVREGIDDYRYVYTLDEGIKAALAANWEPEAVESARRFREELFRDIVLDLNKYYTTDGRVHEIESYWQLKPDNPWNGEKFTRTRRQCAEHILALRQAAGSGK